MEKDNDISSVFLDLRTAEAQKASGRNVRLDLLRSVAMFMIVGLHYLSKGGLLWHSENGSAIYYASWILESLCLVSVNCYVLISGYFLAYSQKTKIKKMVELILQVEFYSVFMLLVTFVLGYRPSVMNILQSLLPLFTKQYWFINVYICLYLLHPYINLVVEKLDKKNYGRLLLICYVFFTFAQTVLPIKDMTLDSTGGYGIIWFICLYLISGYVRRFDFEIKKVYCIFTIIICTLILPLSYSLSNYVFSLFGKTTAYTDWLYSYNTLPVFVSSVAWFLLFRTMNIPKGGQIISLVGSATLGVYLFHEQKVFRVELWRNIVHADAYYDSPFVFLHMTFILLIIFSIGILIDLFRQRLFNLGYKAIEKKTNVHKNIK